MASPRPAAANARSHSNHWIPFSQGGTVSALSNVFTSSKKNDDLISAPDRWGSSLQRSTQRWIVQVKMMPRKLHVLMATCIVVVILATTTYSFESLLGVNPRFRRRSLDMSLSPRILQLSSDDVTMAGPVRDNIPKEGLRELLYKYNPLPHDSPILKAASTLNKGKCKEMYDWQVSHNENCNVVHEASWGFVHPLGWESQNLPEEYEFKEDQMFLDPHEQIRLVAGGAFRWVWMVREFDGTRRALKTLRVDGKTQHFDLRNFDRHRRDAVAMDQLTPSPLVVDMYGYCANTGIFDWGEGGDLTKIFQKNPDISDYHLLQIAYNVSMSIHDAHHFDKQGRATMAHTDIKPDQFLFQDGYYRLTDFNRVRFLGWNDEENKECGFRVQKNGGLWRAPEEYAYSIETEKVDVYSLGNVLYFLLTAENPWKPLPLKQIYEKVMNGERPPIPDELQDSDEIFDRYMIQAMKMAWTHDRTQRPGAFEVAQKLKEGIEEYEKLKG